MGTKHFAALMLCWCVAFTFAGPAGSAPPEKQTAQTRQEKLKERKKAREIRRQQQDEKLAERGGLIQDLIRVSREEQEKRNELKAALTQGKGIQNPARSVALTLPFVSKQHDGWSCGLHTATRLLKFHNHDVSYEGLMKQRKLVSLQLDSDKGPYTLPHALQGILRQRHPDSWWMTDVDFEVIKNLLRRGDPVAALVAIPGSSFAVRIGERTIKAPATHWVTVSGFDDPTQTISYYDPLKEGVQKAPYEEFNKVWNTRPEDFAGGKFDPLLLAYGMIASRTIAFCQ